MIRLTSLALAISALLLPPFPADAQQAAQPVQEPKPSMPLPEGAVVYHALSGREAQVVFTSDAPLEKIVGKSNAVVGYVVPGPKDQPAKLAGAAFILPVRSLATGIPLRDEHLVDRAWLNAESFPTIDFVLTNVEDIKEIKRGEGFTTWSVTLVGDMTLHGVKRQLRVPDARLSFFQESDKTRSIAPGDLLFLKCEYTVRMSDFGIRHADVPKKVSDQVTLAQMIRLSSASPSAIEAASKQARQVEASAETPNQPPR